MIRKSVYTVFAMLLTLAFANVALAATKTNDLNVTASVAPSCRIMSVADIGFGAYDPTDPADLDAAGDMKFRCVKNTTYWTYIVGTRQMTDGTDLLNFQLYTDSGRLTAYPSTKEGGGTSAPSNAEITTDIYGRIPNQQDVEVGSYTVTLTATVEY